MQAECHGELKQDEQALQKALQARKEDSSYGWAWSKLGVARYNLQQWDEAVTCWEKAIELGLPTEEDKQHVLEWLPKAKQAAAAMRRRGKRPSRPAVRPSERAAALLQQGVPGGALEKRGHRQDCPGNQ